MYNISFQELEFWFYKFFILLKLLGIKDYSSVSVEMSYTSNIQLEMMSGNCEFKRGAIIVKVHSPF